MVGWSRSTTMPLVRFHTHNGVNIGLSEEGQVARRVASFANAITFSEKPLLPGEIFLVEVDEQEPGWSGHLRCGLTQHIPSKLYPARPGQPIPGDFIYKFLELDEDERVGIGQIPQYSMPDLTKMGKSWIFAITKYHNKVPEPNRENGEVDETNTSDFIKDYGDFLLVGHKPIPKALLVKDFVAIDMELAAEASRTASPYVRPPLNYSQRYFPTSIGSRIGVTYELRGGRAYMHFLINGEDQGASLMEEADLDQPFHASIDVYGTTKQVRILQLNYGKCQVLAFRPKCLIQLSQNPNIKRGKMSRILM